MYARFTYVAIFVQNLEEATHEKAVDLLKGAQGQCSLG